MISKTLSDIIPINDRQSPMEEFLKELTDDTSLQNTDDILTESIEELSLLPNTAENGQQLYENNFPNIRDLA